MLTVSDSAAGSHTIDRRLAVHVAIVFASDSDSGYVICSVWNERLAHL